jgi:hypothetical protein
MTSGAGNGPATPGGLAGILTDPRQVGEGKDGVDQDEFDDKEADEAEQQLVDKKWKEYDDARKFDENYRKQIAIDRRYAAGTSDLSWAVTTNLIGAFIDILVALLYARNPDVSVRKSPQVDESNTYQMQTFARTMEIVISSLWKKGNLKKPARRAVRSVLSNAEGWLKCTMVSEKKPMPEVEKALNDAQETHARIVAQNKLIKDNGEGDPEALEAEKAEKQALIDELQEKLEVAVAKMFVIDYVESENIQVSTDVNAIENYLDADWISNELYIPKDDALARFPRISPEDVKSAKIYYQRAPKEMTTRDIDNVLPQGTMNAENAQAFVTTTSNQESPAFVRVVEIWDRRDKQIRTLIDGVKKWAKEPYAPPYPTSRFYPYFYFAFYEVDGQRHPQSLSWRLYKLQDEYSSCRSNFRLTRERSIPGVLFNATMLDEVEAKSLQESKSQEYTALRPSDPNVPLANLFAPKPVQGIDMRLYDPTLILNDMERISGVQEALSAAINGPGNPKTATEANIQQSGTQARTTSDRDNLESMLTDLAQYTAEQSLQCLETRDVQRLAGPKAFWPVGMDIEDLFTLVEIQIEAGSTGKPRQATDMQAWSTILPLIQKSLGEIQQAFAMGNAPMANAQIELIKETMLRLGDESDVERFIPRQAPPGSPGSGAPPPPIMPQVSISLKGVLDPQTTQELAAPAVMRDASTMPPPVSQGPQPQLPGPGGAPAPGLPPQASPAAPPPGAGPIR